MDPELVLNMLNKAYIYLEDSSDLDSSKIVIGPGFCAGGRLALILGS